MGFGSWLRRKIDEFDEKQRRKMEERKYYEQIKRKERAKELGRIQARKDVEKHERRRREFFEDPMGLRRSDDYWERVSGRRIYGTKRKKKK